MKTPKVSFLLAVVWLLLATTLHCIPGSRIPKINWQDKILLDKWVHFFLFLILVLLWCAYFVKGSKVKVEAIFLKITILSMIYAIGMELVQHFFIPLRSFAFGDILADGLVSIAGYFISLKRFVKNKID
ncbi:MAG TPA: VanZ family protein [Chitinophagaceae bacterium]|nr:VanZ family protein [Chitinophagaceae bacterium]